MPVVVVERDPEQDEIRDTSAPCGDDEVAEAEVLAGARAQLAPRTAAVAAVWRSALRPKSSPVSARVPSGHHSVADALPSRDSSPAEALENERP